ncbi:hypothetical protein [Psychroflexus tropicus]|uniref:hypothetical protein n=1 Tax=Psychroflexus tropicus TaxID=197345 RepID=UPI000362D28F|nr:hypothetical protein [Psychroflexus tropicus]
MNLIIIPFHDWRKSENEGFRTRDVHFIKAFAKNDRVEKILIINRPFTKLELLLNQYKQRLPGELIFKRRGFALTKVSDKIYVLDYLSLDVINQILLRHKWFIRRYGDKKLLQFIYQVLDMLDISNTSLICQNVFSNKLAIKLKSKFKLFDAWDNFTKFPNYSHLNSEISNGYNSLSEHIKTWITNSKENQDFFKDNFGAKKISLIKNGVSQSFAKNCLEVPQDMRSIPHPIAGFGGKMSYLIDTDIINYIVKDNPDISFVFVGQILDKEKFKEINNSANLYFLGDKKYDIYPCYVNNFDVGIIPYEINDKQHGGDSIKAYEYLQAGLKVIGTHGNGLLDLSDYLYLAKDKFQFSEFLKKDLDSKKKFDSDKFSWESKSEKIISLLEHE